MRIVKAGGRLGFVGEDGIVDVQSAARTARAPAAPRPELATVEEIDDPDDLAIGCVLNGEMVQNARTSDLIFSVPTLNAYLSSILPLYPGDVVLTGTPAGVGHGLTPPRYLSAGDELATSVQGIGVQGIGMILTTFAAPG